MKINKNSILCRYYRCLNQETYERSCPPPSVFHPILLTCTDPEDFSCTLPVYFDCSDKENGFYPHTRYCHKYFYCRNGIAQEHVCDPPELFDREIKLCNFPEFVTCEIIFQT